MSERIKCFWIEPTGQERLWLRRFRSSQHGDPCPLPWGYHDHMEFLKDRPIGSGGDHETDWDRPSDDAVLWPTACNCGYQFAEEDQRQLFKCELYSGAPDGQLYALRDVPAGAMWDAAWAHSTEWLVGSDGLSLHVKLPNGHDWCVDQECSNCTRSQWQPVAGKPNTRHWTGRSHYCWVRHGDPRTGSVHVDKNGNSCAAGAGSILSGNYHGYLDNGYLATERQ